MKRGHIGRYCWGEFSNEMPELRVADVVRQLSQYFIGLRGVNVSWDSGLLTRDDPSCPPEWTFSGKHAVSIPITPALATNWPHSSCGFDEWYFVNCIPTEVHLGAFCNYLGISLAEWSVMNFKGGIDLQAQLEQTVPEIVIGEGKNIYIIAAKLCEVEAFEALASEKVPNQAL
jgi:hypothetical protein